MAESVEEKRSLFTNRLGFVMAASASAVGLGNLWRFPWLTAHYGGGIFVLVYVILALTFGFSLMVAEVSIGRRTGKSCVIAFGDLCRKYKWMGYVIALIPILIVPYYCVIGGWVTKWFFESAIGNVSDLASGGGSYFGTFVTGADGWTQPTIWFLVFAAMCMICIIVGVNRGIEKLSRVLMPMLLVMMVGISIYEIVAIDGIWDGIVYYLKPDVSKLSGGTFLGAISQIFYSMSLAMGIMITYGSYMKKKDSIEKGARNISMIDTVVAILAGLMIIPAAFALIGEAGTSEHGTSLMFSMLPQVFDQMPGGFVVAPVFYLLVIFAALTSAVSLLETVVSVISDETHAERKTSIMFSAVLVAVVGLIVVYGFGPLAVDLGAFGADILTILDTITNSILMPVAAIMTCIFIAYVIGIRKITDEVEAEGNQFKFKTWFSYMIRYVCPICLILILIFGLLSMFGIFDIYS